MSQGKPHIRWLVELLSFLALATSLAVYWEKRKTEVVSQTVDKILLDCRDEKFVEKVENNSGPTMTLPSGRVVHRSLLQRQAQPLIAEGKRAVPCLTKWVRSPDCWVRYIAIFALQEITGVRLSIANLGQDGQEERAIEVWEQWWRKNRWFPW